MTEYRRGVLVKSAGEKHRVFKPITVLVTSADKNLYGVIAAQHPAINVDHMQIKYLTLVKLMVGKNSYMEVRHDAHRTNTPKQHVNLLVTRYYSGGETEELFLIAKVDTDSGDLEIAVPQDFVLEVTLESR